MAGNQQVFQNAMNNGNSAAWDQNWELASRYYIAALEEFPNNPTALVNLGLALFERREYEQALAVYRRAAVVSPEDPAPQDKMAQIYETLGRKNDAVRAAMQAAELFLKARDVEKAIECWQRITAMHPDSLTAHTRLALIFERLGRKADAVYEYLAAAGLLQRAGDSSKATQVILYALNLAPGNADATQALRQLKIGQTVAVPTRPRTGPLPSTSATRSKLPETAADSSERQLDPIADALQRALVELAGSLFDQPEEDESVFSQPKLSLETLRRGRNKPVTEAKSRSTILMHIGQAIELQTHGQEAQAAEELEKAQEAGFSTPALFFTMGVLHAGREEEKAIQALTTAEHSPEFALAAFLVKGRVYYRTKQYHQAAQACLQALRLADAETVPVAQQAELRQLYDPLIEGQSRANDDASLKALCDKVFSHLIRPDWRDLTAKARSQLPAAAPGQMPTPLSELLLEIRSVNVIDALAYIRTLSDQGKVRTAREEAFRAIGMAPTYLPLHIQIGDLLLREGQQPEAIKKYLLVARLYTLRGEAGQAILLIQRILKIAPMDLDIRKQLIELLISQRRIDEAIQEYINLAKANYQLADLEGAARIYQSAMLLAPESTRSRYWAFQILNQLTDIEMQRLDWRSALQSLEQMRKMQPEDTGTRGRIIDLNFRLGYDENAMAEADQYVSLLETKNQPAAAAGFLIGLAEEHPDKLDLRRRLVDLYLRGHRITEAIEQLDGLADSYAQAGLNGQAAEIVEEIIGLNPPNRAGYEKVLATLKKMG
ncbi:MAG: tetratricopeptide repeat protein [Bellilinea sp.]